MIVPISIMVAVFISCLISPVHAEMRYAYPAIFIAPIIIVLAMIPQSRCIQEEKMKKAKDKKTQMDQF